MRPRLALAGLAICGLAAAGCSSGGSDSGGPRSGGPPSGGDSTTSMSPPTHCVAQGGARCPGPAPVTSALIGHLYIASRTQSRLFGDFRCGGRLRATESARRVVITYLASRVQPGGMACAKVKLSVALDAPLQGRTVIDSVTGHRLPVTVKPNA